MGICLIIKSGGGTDTSNATATADKILSGYTVYSNDNKITGSMTNVGTQMASGLNAGGNTTIKAGWHNGNGIITTNTLSSQTQCDIPDDMQWCLSGYTYWKNGTKCTGKMVNRGAKTWSIGANGSQTIEGGWHNGNGTVSQSINVDNGEWGPTPTTTNQQLCWQGWYYSKNRWCWGNGNLTSGNIRSGVSIFGVSGSWSGWVDSTIQWNAIGASTAIRNLGEYTITGDTYTPKGVIPFQLEFRENIWSKLINLGMNYVCFDSTVNLYRTTNAFYITAWGRPWFSCYAYGSIYDDMRKNSSYYDRVSGGHGRSTPYPGDMDHVDVSYNTKYDNGYGSDIKASGKYNIKEMGDYFLSDTPVARKYFKTTIRFGINCTGNNPTGKLNYKSINVWFSKS